MSFRKRVITCLLALALFLVPCIPANTASAASDVRYVRVLLSSYGSPTRVTMKVNGSYYIKEYPSIPLKQGSSITFSISNSKLLLNLSGTLIPLGSSATLVRASSSQSNNWLTLTSPSGYNYPGDMTISTTGSSLRMVVRVFMEDYLQGVVPHEMSNSWPIEALKAQAVASRTYAIASMNSSRDYDVVDTTASQVYRGYNPANTQSLAAIRATAGQALYWNGKISDGVYSASNGGQTRARKPYWGSYNTYHTVKDDPYDLANPSSPLYRFIFPVTCGDTYTLDSRLEGVMLPALVTAAKAKGIDCASDDITIVGFDNISLHTLPASNSNGSYDSSSYEFQKATVTTRVTINGSSYTLDATIETADLKTAFKGATTTLASHRVYYVEQPSNKKCIYIVARGYGHGIGMSQRGAQTMANEGWSYTEILDFYYTGTELKQNGSTADPLGSIPARSSQMGTVVASGVTMRTEASVSAAYVSGGSLASGAQVEILQTSGGWHLVYNASNGTLGYVQSTQVVAGASPDTTLTPNASPSPGITGTVTATNLMVRSGPGTQYAALGSIPFGTTVQIVSKGTDWHCITYKTTVAYVSARYIQLNGDSNADIPVSNPDPTPDPAVMRGEVTASSLNVRTGPSTSYPSLGTIPNGTIVTILEKGSWYKIDYKGTDAYVSSVYIRDLEEDGSGDNPSSTVTPSTTPAPDTSTTLIGTVTASSLRVRSGPGVSYSILGNIRRGGTVTILERGRSWHKISYNNGIGYVGANYVTISEGTASPTPTPTSTSSATVKTGTVNASSLYVRSGPGTSYSVLGSLPRNATVSITVVGDQWHTISYNGQTGYVSADYIVLSDSSSTPTPTPTPMPTPTPTPTAAPSTTPSVTQKGTVTGSSVRVRSGAGTNYSILGSLGRNAEVTILETLNGWYKISFGSGTGYISSDYVSIAGAETTPAPTPTPSLPSETVYGTVTVDSLLVRSGAGTNYSSIGSLNKGAIVLIQQAGLTWHRIDYQGRSGYVSASYVEINEDFKVVATGVTTTSVNLRKGPSTIYAVSATLPLGAKVSIVEEGSEWHTVLYNGQLVYVQSRYISIT